MRTAALMILLPAMILHLGGYMLFFKVKQSSLRAEIKAAIKGNIPEKDLVYFTMSHDAYKRLQWVKPEKEFRTGVSMYDIIRIDTSGNTLRLVCINDIREKELHDQLDKLVKQSGTAQSEKNAVNIFDRLFQFFQPESRLTFLPETFSITISSKEKQADYLFSPQPPYHPPRMT